MEHLVVIPQFLVVMVMLYLGHHIDTLQKVDTVAIGNQYITVQRHNQLMLRVMHILEMEGMVEGTFRVTVTAGLRKKGDLESS